MTRWLAWLVACTLLAGLISAGALVLAGDAPGQAVMAAGDRSDTVGVTSTVTVPISVPPPAPSTTMRTTTTLSKAAVAVLNAIASTTTTTATPPPPPVTTTTRASAPATTTPAPPTPTTAASQPTTTLAPTTTTTIIPPTSTTVPARFTLTIVNNHPRALVVTVNGREFPLAVGQTLADTDLPVVPAGDEVQVRTQSGTGCGSSNNGALFDGGARYRLNLVTDVVVCTNDVARPKLDITRL